MRGQKSGTALESHKISLPLRGALPAQRGLRVIRSLYKGRPPASINSCCLGCFRVLGHFAKISWIGFAYQLLR
jgi:hypothetical protein